jgi:outer membrane protein OmpA-like peptidoglycan-associated protein
MCARAIALLLLLWCWATTQAQEGSKLKFRYWAISYCKDTQQPLAGLLITLTAKDGHRDSLLTDTLGVARTSIGADTLELRSDEVYQIEVSWPDGSVRLRDRVETDSLYESTTFIKEYFVWDCNDPRTDHRWLPPSVYFPPHSSIPRIDSAWYQVESVDAIVEVLKDNPTLVIRTIGYCDAHERDRERLADARAKHVRQLIVDRGMPPERVEAEGRAAAQRYSKAEINNMKDREERVKALARDRQVGYLVVSFDYKP